MKKVFLLSLSLALGFSAFAQQRVAKDDVRKVQVSAKKAVAGKEMAAPTAAQFAPQQTVVGNRNQSEEFASTMWTYYDLQSNHYVANRMYQLPNGSVAATATMSHTPSASSVPDRGTGYNFFKEQATKEFTTGEWIFGTVEEGAGPEDRVEPVMSGWPSIAPWGEQGEILLSHGGGALNCYTREIAGEGEWVSRGALPPFPEGYPYSEYPTWPRVVTSGENHNIIHVAAILQHSISSDETDLRTVMWRSEDAENWTVSYGPLEEVGYHIGVFSADDYCMAANGHNVAILYSGSITNSVWISKSTDDGLTWNTYRVWEDPYEGKDLNVMDWEYSEDLYRPMNGAIAIDNNGVAHVALNVFEMTHTLENEPGYYSYYYGRAVDGILYWNDTQEAPIQSEDGNPHNAARLWWPIPDDPDYIEMHADSTKWIGYLPMYYDANGSLIAWDNNKEYLNEYTSKVHGNSAHPALSIDPYGNIACAYSAPCTAREANAADAQPYYLRSIYVSYYNVDEGYWHQVEDDLIEPVFDLELSDCLFTMSAPNVANPGEFWFGFQADYQIGLSWGSNATQPETTQNDIYVVKVVADPEMANVNEAINPMTTTRVYPNPTTDVLNIEVNASMASEMSISVYNIMGQNVMNKTVSINAGLNFPSISTSDLNSGIYFVTVKANGFENTMKFIVK